LLPGTYNITVKDSNGCTSLVAATVSFSSGIANLNGNYDLNIYPNPASTALTIDFKFEKMINNLELSIIDLIGNTCLKMQFNKLSALHQSLDVSRLSAGNYLLVIKADQETYHEKLHIIK